MLFMEDPLEGINSPLDYIYVRLLRMTLKILFHWPSELFGEKTWKYAQYRGVHTIVQNALILSSNIAYLVAHGSKLNVFEIGHMYLTMLLLTLALSRSMVLQLNPSYKNIVVAYFTSMHLFYHAKKSEYAKSVHIRIHKVCHIVCLNLFFQMMIGLSLFNVIPMYLNYSKGKLKYRVLENTTYELSVYLYFPRDATTNRDSYHFLATFNWYASYMCSSVICMTDVLLFLMVFHIYGHFKILINLLSTFPKPALTEVQDDQSNIVMGDNQMYSEAECVEVYEKLKECIKYHKYLIEFTKTMSSTFGPMLLVYYAFSQASCCFLLLECSQLNAEALIRYGPFTLIVFQELIQISVIFEIIGIMSEKLNEAIYTMPWETMDLRNRKVVLFFLMNTQKPIHVKAMGILNVGVVTMLTILKTSISYFAVLRTVPQ